MNHLLVGLDIGGTKTHVRAEAADGTTRVNVVVPSDAWSASPTAAAARWISSLIDQAVAGTGDVVSVGVGAQGCDTQRHCDELSGALRHRLAVPCRVTNDADLLIPAAGLKAGIGVIAGTGSIAVGHLSDGDLLFAGGWGWVLGDEGSAAALVRDAVRAVLRAGDRAMPDDGLAAGLLDAFGVPGLPELARAVNDEPTAENWSPHAPVVFTAADHGSARADLVIRTAGAQLARLVPALVSGGAVGTAAVAAGSVIVNQPRLFDSFTGELHRLLPHFDVHRLTVDPVVGALALARRVVAASANANANGSVVSPVGS